MMQMYVEHTDWMTGWKHDPQAHADGEKLVDWGKGQNNCPAKCSELAVRPRILKSPTERRLSWNTRKSQK